MADELLVERRGPVAVVTMNRPEQRNALNGALRAALLEEASRLDADDEVGAIVLTGTDPAFCGGLDLEEIVNGELDVEEIISPDLRDGHRIPASPLPLVRTPLLGAVNGPAVTGGLELALRCDFLVASERARFVDTHARVGIQPGWGLTVRLADAIGTRRAREMSVTGNFIDAATALTWGLVNHVVPHAALLPTAVQLATDVAHNERDGVRRVLRTYEEIAELHHTEALLHEADVGCEWARARTSVADEVAARREAVLERSRSQRSPAATD